LILLGLILFPITYTLFALFYSLYGSVLYVLGPLVLALYPALGAGTLARAYLVNLMIFHGWGVIYAIFGALMSAVNLGSLDAVLNAGSVAGSFMGSSQQMLLALTSILFSVSIALIPFLARRVVQGDLGSTMFAVIGAAITAGQVAAAAYLGSGGGFEKRTGSVHDDPVSHPPHAPVSAPQVSSSQPPAPIPERAAESGGVAPASSPPPGPISSASSHRESAPPQAAVSSRPGRPGLFHGFSYTHAAAWAVGSAVGAGVVAGRKVLGSNKG
jgi:hypothetical protein